MSERTTGDIAWRMYAVALTLFLSLLFASRPDPAAPSPAVQREARRWVEQCASGYLGDRLQRIDRIVWRALPDSASAVRARTVLPDTILIHAAWREDVWTVAHEMLHVAIGRPGHPAIPFAVCGLLAPEH